MPSLRLLLATLLTSFALFAAPARAYWEYGHETVAAVAWQQMRPETRSAVAALLGQGALLETPDCPVATIEQASLWADCIKPMRDRFGYAFSWHYQNVDVCKPFDLTGPCRDGHCVSAQIERNARLVADRAVPRRERLTALAFLVHFVGDLHQPMHAGDRGDLGGNRVLGNYGLVPSNLHSIWDGYLAERAISTPPGGARGLLDAVPPAERVAIAGGSVEQWSREMWAKAREQAYASFVGDPCGSEVAAAAVLDEAEVRALIPRVLENVVAGGLRLARLLDDALGPEAKAPGQRPR